MKMKTIMTFTIIILRMLNSIETSWISVPDITKWFPSYLSAESSSSDRNCSSCVQNRVTRDEQDPILKELRVEYVKQQILKKLRLERPPAVSLSLSALPKPLTNGYFWDLGLGEPIKPQIPAESFYGKTNQIVIFPNEDLAMLYPCLIPAHMSKYLEIVFWR